MIPPADRPLPAPRAATGVPARGVPRGVPVVLAALLAGCTIPHEGPSEHLATPAGVGLMTGSDARVAAIAPQWWQAMGDPQLDRIIADALAGNPSLDDAAARLKLAGAAVAVTKAGLLPQASVDASVERQRFSANYIYPAPLGGSDAWISQAQANVSWSLDLAGRQKAMIDVTRAISGAVALDAQAARITLAGSVAQAYVGLARAEADQRIAREFIASREAGLGLVQKRRRAGLANDLDIANANTLLAEARQAEVRAHGARSLMVHALAALAGRGADYYATLTPVTLDMESALPVPGALPADLLSRRADILARRRLVDADLAGIRVARAAFYPNVDLRGFVGATALGIGKLFSVDAIDAGAGPALHLPIFSGGALKAKYNAALAFADKDIADYNTAVLSAVREAADGISAVNGARADAAQQHVVVAGIDQTLKLDRTRMNAGLSTRLDVLTAGERLLNARQDEVGLLADGLTQRIRLAIALGGGFVADGGPPDTAMAAIVSPSPEPR